MKTFQTMYKTEFKLGIRQMDVPIFAFAFPVTVAVILGLIYSKNNPHMIGKAFVSASTIGIAAMGLMGLPLTISGYRDHKILKQLKASPVNPSIILFVQFVVKFTLSLISSTLVWFVLTLFFEYRMVGNLLVYFLAYVIVVFAVFGIGMLIASISKDASMAGVLCSIVYFPMLIFSGATIPLDILPKQVVAILQVLPLTQGINLLQAVAYGGNLTDNLPATLIMAAIGLLSMVISIKIFQWE